MKESINGASSEHSRAGVRSGQCKLIRLNGTIETKIRDMNSDYFREEDGTLFRQYAAKIYLEATANEVAKYARIYQSSS